MQLESLPNSTSPSGSASGNPTTSSQNLKDLLAPHYEPVRLLKTTFGVSTYLGMEVASRNKVIIKMVPHESPGGARLRLEHEATLLRELDCESIASPLHFRSTVDSTIMVCPYVPGISLGEKLSRTKLSIKDTLHVANKLMLALKEAHEHGVLHSDIKPSNVIVSDEVSDSAVTLIDFGFAWSLKLDISLRDIPAGSASYFAPERVGVMKCIFDERSDLYSVGVLLYECLTGKCPFGGSGLGEIFRKHLTFYPPPLRHVRAEVPKALDELIQRLLAKDPRERYQTAVGVLSDLEEIANLLASGVVAPAVIIGKSDRRRTLAEPAFTGRQEEIRQARLWWQQAKEGKGGLLLLEAESGGGKTRLLEELGKQCLAEECNVFWGQGLDQAAQRPFQLLVGVAEQSVRLFSTEPEQRHFFSTKLKDQAQAICDALPEYRALFKIKPEILGPEDFGEVRNLQALAKLLDELGTASRPAFIILDDCQWADELTLKLIQHWSETRTKAGKVHLLIVIAFRSEEVKLGHLLRRIQPLGRIILPSLKSEEISGVIESMAGPLPPTAISSIIKLADGSPFMASAVLRGLVESKTLVPSHSGWKMEETDFARISSSRVAASFLVRRLELLPSEHLEALSVAAILGKEFSISRVVGLSKQDSVLIGQTIGEARRRHIVWDMEKGDHFAFVHDKLREALLSRLAPQTKKKLHLKAALFILEQDSQAVFDLAYHYDAAGEYESALPYAIAAATLARKQNSLEIALQHYRIAERGVGSVKTDTLRMLREGIGDVLLLKGDYTGAAEQYSTLTQLTKDPVERAKFEGKLGDIAFRRGDVKAACDLSEKALRILGGKTPSTAFHFAVAAGREIFVQILHSLFPRVFVGRRKTFDPSSEEFHCIRIYSRMAYIYWFGRGKIPCLWAHLREMNLAERYPPTPELAQAYSEHAPVMTMIPLFNRGIKYAKRGLEMRRKMGDLWGQGQSLHFYGVVLYGASRYEECIERCREAVRILERTGDRWEVNTANWHLGFSLYRLGELAEAVEVCRQVHQAGKEINDRQAAGISLSGWARASLGKIPKEIISAELRQRNGADAHTTVEIYQAEGVRLLEEGETSQAVKTFGKAIAVTRDAGLHQEYVAPVFSWLVTALRKKAQVAKQQCTPYAFREALEEIKTPLKVALRLSRKYRNNLPHILREAGLVAALKGKAKLSRRYFDESERIAESQGAKFELMQTYASRSSIGGELGWETTDSDASHAARLRSETLDPLEKMSALPKDSPLTKLSIEDRFDTLLDVGRSLCSSLSETLVFEAVKDAALKLLRAENCLIFKVEGDRISAENAGGIPEGAGQLLRRAIETAVPIIGGSEVMGDGSESLILSGFRSVLCAPILVRGKVAGCFYVVHRRVSDLFGEDEKRLASFIGTLAGSALENVGSFASVEALSENRKRDLEALTKVQEELAKRAHLLAQSNSDLEHFAHIASHDLKEPVRVVLTFMQLLEARTKNSLDAESNQFVQIAMQSSKRMYALIEALLLYSRIGSHKDSFEEVKVDKRLEEAVQNLKAVIDEAGAEIIFGTLPVLHGNGIQVMQLFQNLIANAIKFRSKRTPRIVIDATRGKAEWIFSVSDNGIGIDSKYSEKIFIIFQRLHRSEEYPGTGVGLAICKRIVELHGGRIWVTSEIDKGTTFTFTIPDKEDTKGLGRHNLHNAETRSLTI